MTSDLQMQAINSKEAAALLESEGPLAKGYPHFEHRPEQVKMLENILAAYQENHITLIEAGTGTGKSLAYLLPAILWTLQNQQKTLIATHTINLQEQLIEKDLPLILKIFGFEIKAVIVKGMGNYLCQRKLDEAAKQIAGFSSEEKRDLEKLILWNEKTATGCKSDLNFTPKPQMWERVGAESDTCTYKKCPFFDTCHFTKARNEVEDANLLITNHSLLFHDLAMRKESGSYEEPALLPPYSRIILDEAHTIEEVATQVLADKISQQELYRLATRLAHPKVGKISQMAIRVQQNYTKLNPTSARKLSDRLLLDLPLLFSDLFRQFTVTFEALNDFMQTVGNQERSLRILPHHFEEVHWKEKVLPACGQLEQMIKNCAISIHLLEKDFLEQEEDFVQQTATLRKEIGALASRLKDRGLTLKQFIDREIPKGKVRWIENKDKLNGQNLQLVSADLDISTKLADSLFSKIATVVLLSATLTTNNTFKFIRKRLGLTTETLPDKRVIEANFASPFNYLKQALLVVPNDMPTPDDPRFVASAAEAIIKAVHASRGSCFVLFTSFYQMNGCFEKVRQSLEKQAFTLFKQGDESKVFLIDKFKQAKKGVLFGTSSFWQGVDVAGDALRCVIIVKLPFQVPSEPLVEARFEALQEDGKNAFYQYSIPNAIVRFKQGFGRLIRNQKDRGCIVCLDSRLVTKSYGKLFLQSLPECRLVSEPLDRAFAEMQKFYLETNR